MIFAIGSVLCMSVLALAAFDFTKNVINSYQWLQSVVGLIGMIGVWMMLGSTLALLWRVMP